MKKLIYALAIVGLMSTTATAQTFKFDCLVLPTETYIYDATTPESAVTIIVGRYTNTGIAVSDIGAGDSSAYLVQLKHGDNLIGQINMFVGTETGEVVLFYTNYFTLNDRGEWKFGNYDAYTLSDALEKIESELEAYIKSPQYPVR